MHIYIPVWIFWTLGAVLGLVVLPFALLGIYVVASVRNFRLS